MGYTQAMKYSAVMFDLDGTLADSLADIATASNHALTLLGRPQFAIEQYRYLAGQGLEALMVEALGPDHQALVPQGMSLFHTYYKDHSMDFTRPYSGIPELLDELTARQIKRVILSNKPHQATVPLVKHVFDRWSFDVIQGHEPPALVKPDPTQALRIARKLDIPPDQWLYVGDTSVDMLTATGSGFYPVGVVWGFRDEPELRESGAKTILKHPLDLLNLL